MNKQDSGSDMMKKNILVVDNDLLILEFMTELLEGEGHKVVTAEDGVSALEILTSFAPDIMFVDLVMPRISGDKLCAIVRKMESTKGCYLAVLSGAIAEKEWDFLKIGANAYVPKTSFSTMAENILSVVHEANHFRNGETQTAIVGLNQLQERQMTKELLSQNRHLEIILESICDGILEVYTGKIVYANSSALSLLGLKLEDTLGSYPPDLFDPLIGKRVEKLLDSVPDSFSESDPEMTLEINGRMLTLKSLALKEKASTTIVLINDITEQKKTEEILRKQAFDLDKKVKELNCLFTICNLIKTPDISLDEIIESLVDLIPPAWQYSEVACCRIKLHDHIYETQHFNEASWKLTSDIKVHSEPIGTVEVYYLEKRPEADEGPFTNDERILINTIAERLGNICEQMQAEEEKQQLEEKLHRVEKMEAIGTLVGGVAHDLNNILTGLVSYPELLLLDLAEDNHLRKALRTIQKSGQKAVAIVQDLLTLARRGVVVKEVVNLNQIIREYLISPEFQKLRDFHSNFQLERNLDTELMNIMGSSVHLSKTVMNLLSNAAEAMLNGGSISIRTENQYIDRAIQGYDRIKEGDYVVLQVVDTGIGIPLEDIERIFEPFYTKKVMGRSGTGLGMAVVWGTVKDHNGYINVQSIEGRGATFTLYFPATRQPINQGELRRSIEDYMGHHESILVVDDVEDQREIASGMLEKLGYIVSTVSSGKEAIEYMKENSADLIVLDMIMEPGMDGLESYKRILEFHPMQKAIIASGFSETRRVKEAQQLGVGTYIKKPYLLEKIGLAVRAELNKTHSVVQYIEGTPVAAKYC